MSKIFVINFRARTFYIMNILTKTFMASFLIFAGLMLPDYVFSFINQNFGLCFNFDKLGVILILSIILALIKNVKFIVGFLIIFGIMQIIQFYNMAYFGVYLSSYALYFIILEAQDIMTEASDVWFKYLYVPFLVVVPYFIVAYILLKFDKKRVKSKFSYVFLFLFFIYFLYKATTPSGIFQMLFKNTCYSTYNTINSFSGFFGNVLPAVIIDGHSQEKFSPYKIYKNVENINEAKNIILVVGESVSSRNMSIFGYERETTPELVKYAQEDKNFVYKSAWGAAVNTLIALPMIYNIQVNPKNYQKLITKDTNLLKMAKDNNYKVTYIELQNEEVFRKTALSHYDDLYIYNFYKDTQFKGESDYLDYVLKQIKLERRNLIIIHKRNVHSPYEYNYSFEKEKFSNFNDPKIDNRINLYDNAILYEDQLITKILDYAKSSKNETYFYYISDHGEGMGENGVWGHGHLNREALEVPFFFTMFNSNDKHYLQKIKNKYYPCAYDVSILVAEKLGYKIEVPNEDMNVCLINGRDSMGRAGILKVTKDIKNHKLMFDKIR